MVVEVRFVEQAMIPSSIVPAFAVTPFVILFVERAGSSFLQTALKSHPSILARPEKLGALRHDGGSARDQLKWTSRFLNAPLVGRHRAIGFKTKLVDVLDREGFAKVLCQRGVKVIHLQRRNSIKAVVSTLNARRQWEVSGNWNLHSEVTRLPAFTVDPTEFARLLKEREELNRDLENYVQTLELPTLRLWYEDLLWDRDSFLRETLDFLNVPVRRLEATTLKNTKDDLRQAITNFDELRASYEGTPYESMFDEGIDASKGRPPAAN